ncbi:MAG: phage tail tape measure protein [Simkaniaceae bacterium]|nr:phage tail tape measure protein [Simkaniaceae bacterium]
MADVVVEIFGDKDPFKNVRESSKQFLKVVDDLIKKSELLGSTFRKELQGIEFKGLKDVQKLNQQVTGLNKTLKATNDLRDAKVKLDKQVLQSQKESIKTTNQEIASEKKKGVVEREAIKTANERERLRQQRLRTARQVQISQERERKAAEKEKRVLEQNNNAYKKLTKATNEAQAEFKRLAAQFGLNSKQAQEAKRNFDRLDRSLRDINNTAKDGRRDVGRYRIATENLAVGFKNVAVGLVGGLGVIEGLRALGGVLREGLKLSREFGLATGKLQAISGATGEEFQALTDQARELGATTQFTASQVAELQLELSKLGFDPTEIQQATGAVLDFAIATDSALARSGEVIAATLNAFELGADQAGNVADIAAKAFSSSALDIEKFATAISAVGPAANAVDVSLERTTAILGKIVDSGIDASTAGTALRNVFIELSDQGLTFEQALNLINDSQNSLLKANELFGKRGAVVAQVIANNKEAIDELDISLQNSKGSAEEAANVIGDTLEGDIKRLQSAYEGLLLEGGALNSLFRSLTFAATQFIGVLNGLLTINQAFTRSQEKTVKSSEALAKAISTQEAEAENLLAQLRDVNLTESERRDIIDQLNSKYGDYLDNLIDEKDSYEDIERAVRGANQQIVKSIILKQKEQEISQILEDQVDRQRELSEEIVKQRKVLADSRNALEDYENQLKETAPTDLLDVGEFRNRLEEINAVLENDPLAFEKLSDDAKRFIETTGGIEEIEFNLPRLLGNRSAYDEALNNLDSLKKELNEIKNLDTFEDIQKEIIEAFGSTDVDDAVEGFNLALQRVDATTGEIIAEDASTLRTLRFAFDFEEQELQRLRSELRDVSRESAIEVSGLNKEYEELLKLLGLTDVSVRRKADQ